MSNCGKLFKSSLFDCDNPLQPGVRPRLILFNLEDLQGVTFNTSPDQNVIKTITLAPGATAFVFEGFRNTVNPQQNKVDNEFTPFSYDHLINFPVYDVSQQQKDNIEGLSIKKVVGIIQNADNTFELYGISLGLDLITLTRSPGGQENGGTFAIQVKTPDGAAKEAKLPQTVFNTDFTTTLDLINDLLNLPIITNVSPLAAAAAGGTALIITGDNFFNTADTPADDVSSVDWINQDTQAVTNEPGFVTDNDGQITIASSVVLVAEDYKLRVTTSAGVAESEAVIVVS